MKKLIFVIVLCTCGLMSQTTTAQISFKLNISSQPIWGPVGYNHVEYYYLPEVEAYYYVPTHMYFYQQGGRWISRASLPPRYRGFNMYNARKIVINEPRPYLRHNNYRVKYRTANSSVRQASIRDSRDSKYFVIKDHPQNARFRKEDNRNNGRDQGRGNKDDNKRDRR